MLVRYLNTLSRCTTNISLKSTLSTPAYFSTVAENAVKKPNGPVKVHHHEEIVENNTIVVTKNDVPQSPWKMRFLVMLARGAWLPDALAQMEFSPKVRSEEISKMLKRASILARMQFNAIPEELRVKEVIVTKGQSIKKMRIMGRGRTGFGYSRYTHVRIVVEKVDFKKHIADQTKLQDKKIWGYRQKVAIKARENANNNTNNLGVAPPS